MKKAIAVVLMLTGLVFASGCGNNEKESKDSKFSAAMTTDLGGIYDQSFNMSTWQGLQRFAKDTGAEVKYLESVQVADFSSNLNKLADENIDFIWGVGYALADALKNIANIYPDKNFGIIDISLGNETPKNVTCVTFRSQESGFLAGYIAGKTTKTNQLGFVGGMDSMVIDQFKYGYKAGAEYAAKELGKKIDVEVQYAESFSAADKGKAIALKMFSKGSDIIFHAAGGAGVGVIAAAEESNKFAIGVDMDQSYLAPKHVLTSALKNVDQAVYAVSRLAQDINADTIISKNDYTASEGIGGKTFSFGLKEKCVGIPENNPNLSDKVYDDAMKVQEKIANGEITVPYNAKTYETFVKTL